MADKAELDAAFLSRDLIISGAGRLRRPYRTYEPIKAGLGNWGGGGGGGGGVGCGAD